MNPHLTAQRLGNHLHALPPYVGCAFVPTRISRCVSQRVGHDAAKWPSGLYQAPGRTKNRESPGNEDLPQAVDSRSTGLGIAKGCGRVGHRRVALSHVSCAPSSNWTCGFPASSSPTIFFRRRAPQAGQVTHSPYHLVQPAAFVQELIVPALPSRPPTTLMFASEP